ncbi:MAG: hypothetical protein PHV07_06115 [Oscillospiraceae bacterium]|nr:hypothetical protein [Oscillospiraceae bacterium]
MIKLIIGKKGSGKTKNLINAVTEASNKSAGNVVCVEMGPALTYDIPSSVRLINTEVYGIAGYDAFYGFLSGICAGNYDVTDIFVDATLRIGSRDYNELADFIVKVDGLAKESNTNMVFTVSCDESELPARIFEFAQKA